MFNWEEIRYYDWKSITITSAMLLGFALFCCVMLNKGHIILLLAQKNLTRVAKGQIVSKYNNLEFKQTTTGNKLRVGSLTVYYSYIVNGQNYTQKQVLEYSLIDAHRLNEIYSTNPPIPVTVLYDNKNPRRSSITLDTLIKPKPLFQNTPSFVR